MNDEFIQLIFIGIVLIIFILLGVLAYMYIYDKDERREMLAIAESLAFYLDYADNIETKLVAVSYKIFGLSITCAGLGIVKRARKAGKRHTKERKKR